MNEKTQQAPPPPPPPKTFNEVTLESLEFCVAEIAKHRTAIVAIHVALVKFEEKLEKLDAALNALEVKHDCLADEIRPLPPAA